MIRADYYETNSKRLTGEVYCTLLVDMDSVIEATDKIRDLIGHQGVLVVAVNEKEGD